MKCAPLCSFFEFCSSFFCGLFCVLLTVFCVWLWIIVVYFCGENLRNDTWQPLKRLIHKRLWLSNEAQWIGVKVCDTGTGMSCVIQLLSYSCNFKWVYWKWVSGLVQKVVLKSKLSMDGTKINANQLKLFKSLNFLIKSICFLML